MRDDAPCPRQQTQLTRASRSPDIILGCYVIVFGLGRALPDAWLELRLPVADRAFSVATAFLEFQIPPQVSRYASFLFSFIGRGICKPPRLGW